MKKINLLTKSIVAFALVSVMLSGCKKEEDKADPNIIFKTYNSVTLTNSTTESTPSQNFTFDVDGDGVNDLRIDASFQNVGGDTTVTQLDLKRANSTDNKVISESFQFPDGGPLADALKILPNGTKINTTSNFTSDGFVVLTAKKGAAVIGSFGFTDGQDKLVGISFKIGSDTHYGWLKVNVSADLKTMKVVEGAYNKTANAEIAAGDK